ncbi:hypothetical protein [Lewinella sp. LCG006]|uniref:hypothetical protein n=1 Tax=Lewinella sp. LCG006 TaxID=3231911 RepID=UPI00345F7321
MEFTKYASLLLITTLGLITCTDNTVDPPQPQAVIEEFTFAPSGINRGKIYLPASYAANKSIPVIYLLDHQEVAFNVATDEFQQVINGVNQIADFDAIVVTLTEKLPTANHNFYPEYFELYKTLAAYVDNNYESNGSKTLIGRGDAAGIILVNMFNESGASHGFKNFVATDPFIDYISYLNSIIPSDNFPMDKSDMKLHYSFTENYELDRNRLFIDRVNNKNYPWLSFSAEEYPNLLYEEDYPTIYADGLKFIFDN